MHTNRFKSDTIISRLVDEDFTLFMAVPTIYNNLTNHVNTLDAAEQARIRERLSRYRLMVSGSAALPESQFHDWTRVSG